MTPVRAGPDGAESSGAGAWSFVPAGAVTGIGSLPVADPAAAVEFVRTWCPRIPFCPQAPGRDLVAVTLDQLDPESEAAMRFDLFARAAGRGDFDEAVALKTQVTGPITLAHLLRVAGAVDTVDWALLGRLAERVGQVATSQVQRLLPVGLPVLVYVDEPVLAWPGPTDPAAGDSVVRVLEAIGAAGGRAGLHSWALADSEQPASAA